LRDRGQCFNWDCSHQSKAGCSATRLCPGHGLRGLRAAQHTGRGGSRCWPSHYALRACVGHSSFHTNHESRRHHFADRRSGRTPHRLEAPTTYESRVCWCRMGLLDLIITLPPPLSRVQTVSPACEQAAPSIPVRCCRESFPRCPHWAGDVYCVAIHA